MPYGSIFHEKRRILLIAVLFGILGFGTVQGTTRSAKVTRIIDGDTFEIVIDDGCQIRIGLAEVRYPQKSKGTPWAEQSKRGLEKLILGRHVRGEFLGRYSGRTYFCNLWVNQTSVNEAMIANGYGWVRRQYSHTEALLEAEAQARAQKRGLWNLSEIEKLQVLLW